MNGQIEQILVRAFKEDGGISYHQPSAQEGGGASSSPGLSVGNRVLVYDTVVCECEVLLELPRDHHHPTLSDLDAAYRAVFDRRKPSEGVTDLLCVLLAAQEPLSLSLLQRMGLDQHLPHLPGWPCLFYEAEHRVFLLHKSLGDWLRDSGRSRNHAVIVPRGHALLGKHFLRQDIDQCRDAAASDLCKSAAINASEYALKYAMLHLCAAAVAAATEGRGEMHALVGVLYMWGEIHALVVLE